jgi:acetylornithine deacetylase/succinyl-diaminopimelate desuccinylase-like protein
MNHEGRAAAETSRLEDEAIHHLRALLRFDTTNPPGNERPAIDHIARALAAEGIAAEIFEPSPGRANLVARLRGDGSEGPLLLSSHVDVVTAEPEKWTHGPFSGDLDAGFVWGRGAIDMKGMTALELASFLALKRSGARLRRDVILLALSDEEAGMRAGSKWMVENEPERIRAEYALNEVGGFSVTLGGRRLYPVGLAEKGFCWLRLRARGEPGHGSMPRAANAIAALARAIEVAHKARLAREVRPQARAFIEAAAGAVGGSGGLMLRGLLSPLTRRAALAAIGAANPEQARVFRAMLEDTITPTGLCAGEKENVIPSEAAATLDTRFLPGRTSEEMRAAVAALLPRGVEVEVIERGEPHEVAADSPLFRTIEERTRAHDPGGRAVPWLNVGFSDSAELARLGVRCHGFFPLRLPADLAFASLFHGHDERVPVDGYRFGARLFYDVVRTFAGGSC